MACFPPHALVARPSKLLASCSRAARSSGSGSENGSENGSGNGSAAGTADPDDTAAARDPTGTEDTEDPEDTLTAHLHLNS
jgi:hypothetical protein